MHLFTRNVNTAFRELVKLFSNDGWSGVDRQAPIVRRQSRDGSVLMIDEPVTITYSHPRERVLFNAARDANPFFHLYEALWMLAGRNDVAPLAYYDERSQVFSDDGKTLNGAYGYRWRHAREEDGYHVPAGHRGVDQLDILVNHLKADPTSRRAVLQMWNVEDDLLKIGKVSECPNCPSKKTAEESVERPGGWPSFRHGQYIEYKAGIPYVVDCPACGGTGYEPASKDVCCNLSVMFSTRTPSEEVTPLTDPCSYLDMTVTNRSNDMIWGMLGANFVHFTILQEYMAARLGVEVGRYHHFTNNLHVYEKNWKPDEWLVSEQWSPEYRLGNGPDPAPSAGGEALWTTVPLISNPEAFERELPAIVRVFDGTRENDQSRYNHPTEPFLREVAWPALSAHYAYKRSRNADNPEKYHSEMNTAYAFCSEIKADDWRIACVGWLKRRSKGS